MTRPRCGAPRLFEPAPESLGSRGLTTFPRLGLPAGVARRDPVVQVLLVGRAQPLVVQARQPQRLAQIFVELMQLIQLPGQGRHPPPARCLEDFLKTQVGQFGHFSAQLQPQAVERRLAAGPFHEHRAELAFHDRARPLRSRRDGVARLPQLI